MMAGEMGELCIMHGKGAKYIQNFLSERFKTRNSLEELGIGDKIILK
jgi:hypothetical protein